MQSLESKVEETAFYNHDSDRAVGVIWPAIVENRLTDLLRAGLMPAPKEFDELFSPGKPLGDFGLKIKIAYICGFISKDLAEDLRTLARIRNAFAHRVVINSFEDSPVNSWLDSLHSIRVHHELLKDLRSRPEKDTTQIFVLENELIYYRNSFNCCIRFLIHHIVDLERNQKALHEHTSKTNE